MKTVLVVAFTLAGGPGEGSTVTVWTKDYGSAVKCAIQREAVKARAPKATVECREPAVKTKLPKGGYLVPSQEGLTSAQNKADPTSR